MKTVNEIFFDSSQKNLTKLNKALEKSGSAMYANAFSQELNRPTCADFPKIRVFVTDSFICAYNFGAMKYDVTILPISAMVNAYRCNVFQNSYDFDYISLVAEMVNGQKVLLSRQYRQKTKNMSIFDDAVNFIRSKKAMIQGGNQPC